MKNKNLEMFLTQIKIKGSQKTAEDYERNIGKFLERINKSETEISYEDLLQYYENAFDNLSVNSKRTYMAPIISYFRFLYATGVIQDDITKMFKLPKAEKKDMEYLNASEAIEVSKACFENGRHKLRKRAMFIMFVNTGMRISELSNLKLEDIKDEWIFINNAKGHKFRKIPLHPSVKQAIFDYMRFERDTDSPYLFVNQHGNKLTNVNVNRDLKNVMKNTTINKNISAHRLRDSFATIQYMNGADIKSIQETLGHESIQMTLHYVQKVDEIRKSQILNAGVQF